MLLQDVILQKLDDVFILISGVTSGEVDGSFMVVRTLRIEPHRTNHLTENRICKPNKVLEWFQGRWFIHGGSFMVVRTMRIEPHRTNHLAETILVVNHR